MSFGIYSANDKAIYDALNQPKITSSDLKELFFSRGILISNETDREDLARVFSRYTHGYHDYDHLAKILGSTARRERTTVSTINQKIDLDKFEEAAESLINDISARGDIATCNRHKGSVEITVTYKTTDFNKSEFKQVVQREATIIVETEGDKIAIRSPLNEHAQRWKDDLITAVEKSMDQELKVDELSLQHISDHTLRTKFFTQLIELLDNYKLYNVTDVMVFHPKPENDDDENDVTQDEQIVHISKASLKGEQVLMSEELQNLYARGFYIWKVVWQSLYDAHGSDLYEFEAQFYDQENCKKFSYLARGFYKRKEDGEHSPHRTQFDNNTERRLGKTIEMAAQKALAKLQADLLAGETDADQMA